MSPPQGNHPQAELIAVHGTQWGDPTETSASRSLVTPASHLLFGEIPSGNLNRWPGTICFLSKVWWGIQNGFGSAQEDHKPIWALMHAKAAPKQPPLPTFSALMDSYLLSTLLAQRTTKKKVTANLKGLFAAQSTHGGTSGNNSNFCPQRDVPTAHHSLGEPVSAQRASTQENRACVTSLCDTITSKSPRTLPLQRIKLCFNGLETTDLYMVQQQGGHTIHIYTLGVKLVYLNILMFKKNAPSLTTTKMWTKSKATSIERYVLRTTGHMEIKKSGGAMRTLSWIEISG